jgi:CrcB protein
MKRLSDFFYVGFGGFFGAVGRFYVSGMAHRFFGKGFPYGTLTVNAAGSFFLGVVSFFAVYKNLIGDNIRLAVAVGFLGAFTTFSTFSYETFDLIKRGSYYLSAINMITNLLLCLAMVAMGISAGFLIDKIF